MASSARTFPSTLIVASHNAGKVREIGNLLAPFGVTTRSAGELGVSAPEETELTFAGNARLKAEHVARATGQPALADDSGLAVAALGGLPGIYSARWAGEPRSFERAMQRVERALGTAARNRPAASFICALALAHPAGATEIFEGRVDGHLTFPPRGEKGFGYDPVFVPEGRKETFAEIDPEEKHRMSHRADAFRRLLAAYDLR